jgi:hypothetical protein
VQIHYCLFATHKGPFPIKIMFHFPERVYKDRKENIFHSILYPRCHNCEDFFDFSRLRLPLDLWTVKKRVEWNRRIYLGNYIWIILVLVLCTSRGILQIGVLFSLCLLWIILCTSIAMLSSSSQFACHHTVQTNKVVREI